MTEELLDPWEEPLSKFARELHLKSRSQMPLSTEVSALAAIFQARVAWESANRQDELVTRLVDQTRRLVQATWGVAIAGIATILAGFLLNR